MIVWSCILPLAPGPSPPQSTSTANTSAPPPPPSPPPQRHPPTRRAGQLLQQLDVAHRRGLVGVQLRRQAAHQLHAQLAHVWVGVAQAPLALQQRGAAQQQEGRGGPGGLVRHRQQVPHLGGAGAGGGGWGGAEREPGDTAK